MRVVLGVTGGIAAYKACLLLRLLTEGGHDVTVVPTDAALRFVGAPTWAALSGKPVQTAVWEDVHEVPHVRLGQQADLVLVAPATADLLARAATGQADDLLTNVLLTARCPVVLAPAMHTEMWEHPATRANVATLAGRGVQVMPPASGRLTGADTGPGRLPEPDEILAFAMDVVEPPYAVSAAVGASSGSTTASAPNATDAPRAGEQLAGRRVVISSGGTREPLDPVRYLGNRSSGKQGHALAQVARERGADVVLVSSAALPAPEGVREVRVETALDLRDAVLAEMGQADVVVMAAAVADFRPATYAEAKIKKTHVPAADGAEDDSAPTITLVRNPDILAELVRRRGDDPDPVIVGFAAETGDESGDVLSLGRAKLARKGCDLLVVNEVGVDKTFGQDTSTVHILHQGSSHVVDVGPASKAVISGAIWDAVAQIL